MDKTQAAPFRQQLLTQQSELLAQLAAQRGGVIGRAEVAAEHFGQPEDPRAQVATERELEFALGERETAHLAAVDAALARIEARTAVVGITTDIIFTPAEMRELHGMIAGSTYHEIDSPFGHDGFLVERDAVFALVGEALRDNARLRSKFKVCPSAVCTTPLACQFMLSLSR